MNERINLRFIDYDPLRAEAMLGIARRFAVEKAGARHGVSGCTVYAFKGWSCRAYWTQARAVVVVEGPDLGVIS
jgi:hypothetical protein